MELTIHQQRCKAELDLYGLRPKPQLSQTFLVDPAGVEHLVEAIKTIYRPGTKIVEVGGGLGYITTALARHFKEIEVLEIDEAMLSILNKKFDQYKNVTIIKKDLRHYVSKEPYLLVGSIPFNLTSVFLKRFLWTTKNKPYALSLILDRQYARTLMNQPPRSYRISILAQLYGELKIIDTIPKEMAYPSPRITAAILNMVQRKKYTLPRNFWPVVHYHFDHFPTPEVKSPKTLGIEDWILLAKTTKIKNKSYEL